MTYYTGNSRFLVAVLIIICNVAASALYPVYRFIDAWAHAEGIDMNIVGKLCNTLVGSELAQNVLASCAGVVGKKDVVETFHKTRSDLVHVCLLSVMS